MAEGTKASVITLDMIRAFAKRHEINLEDGSQYPGVIGSLIEVEEGRGEWPEWMHEPEYTSQFAPLWQAREAAKKEAGEGEETEA